MGLISSAQILSLDTNIFIAAYDPENIHHSKCLQILNEIIAVNPRVFVSVLVFEEFLVLIYKQNLEKNLVFYEDFLTGNGFFTVVDFTKQVARLAAKVRAKYPKVKTPDAIHLASAIESGAKVFITTDKRLPKKVEGLTIQSLRD